jgi:hypothetical protein
MARGKCTFRQRDVAAALKAAFSTGAAHVKVEIDPQTGRIVVVASKNELPDADSPERDWEGV